jgi:GTP diphosphokinase / guanosine-3',5'-bis(diphosphate) 3'-diphosphatase
MSGLAPTDVTFFDKIVRSVSAAEFALVQSAWTLAKAAHSGQFRQSGEAYDTHPLAVAEILFDLLGPDADALCAALLHDVVEDSDTSLASIRATFGDAVAHIVDGVSKLDSVKSPLEGAASSKEETLRKLVGAGGRDWRVFAVKLCDRLHNMRTLSSVRREKQRRVALETSMVYAPLAKYVGFQQIATELEALSLRWCFPWRWATLSRWATYKLRADALRVAAVLGAINWSDGGRLLEQVNRVFDERMVRAFSLLRGDRACRALFTTPCVYESAATMEDAYKRIALLHRHFQCLPASFSCDPREGSVSTKVLLSGHALVAEFVFLFPRLGRCVHDFTRGHNVDGADLAAVASVRGGEGGFTRVLRELVAHTSITVFSPKGRRLLLPRRATGLDFAFGIHSSLGLRANAVRVNSRLCDVAIELSSGDVVEVIAGEEIVALPEWESILRSPRSRAKLRHWIRDSAQQNVALLGRRLLAEAAGVDDTEDALSVFDWSAALAAHSLITRDELFQKIGAGALSAFAVASHLVGTGAARLLRTTSAADERSRLILDGRPVAGVTYCEFCMPVGGDEIVAIGSFTGVTIHRTSCPNCAEGRSSNEVFSPMWAARMACPLPSRITVNSLDRNGLLADCARAISDNGIDVIAVSTQSSIAAAGSVATLAFTVLIRSQIKLDVCLKALSGVVGVQSAARSAMPSHGS